MWPEKKDIKWDVMQDPCNEAVGFNNCLVICTAEIKRRASVEEILTLILNSGLAGEIKLWEKDPLFARNLAEAISKHILNGIN